MRSSSYENKILIVIHLFTSACLIFNAGCDIYFLSMKDYSWNLKAGANIKTSSLNVGYYINISALLWTLTGLFFAICEICMIFRIEFFSNIFFRGLGRPFLYIAMGLINLGICNDLGIVAGCFILIMAMVWLIINCFTMCNTDF